jgi:hypothetical protein
MRKIIILPLIFACFLTTFLLPAQDSLILRYAETITNDELSSHVYKLASDEFEGRFTGTKGLLKAQKYILDEFEAYGLEMPVIEEKSTYLQEFILDECRWKDQRLIVDGMELKVGKDFLFLSDPVEIHGKFPVIFTGFGVEDSAYSDFSNLDVKGKIMLAFTGEPRNAEGFSVISGKKELSKKGYYFSKEKMAADKGAEGVFIISRNRSDYKKYLKARDYYDAKPIINYPAGDDETIKYKQAFSAYMNVRTAARLVDQKPKSLYAALDEMESSLKTTAGRFTGEVSIDASSDCLPLETANVIGIIEGTDLKSQAVVVVAHYDHLGTENDKIFYGADDNASGTAAVMEIAEAFSLTAQAGFRPRRTVIFMAVSAEELGLYGSKYYSLNPLIPLDSTFACINIDMIGRASTKLAGSPDYIAASVYVSEELLEVSREACSSIAPDLEDRVEFKKNLRGGSDHYYFAKHGIPSIFYFTGLHPDYHEPTDTPDKILYDRMEKIVRAIYATAWELANSNEKL